MPYYLLFSGDLGQRTTLLLSLRIPNWATINPGLWKWLHWGQAGGQAGFWASKLSIIMPGFNLNCLLLFRFYNIYHNACQEPRYYRAVPGVPQTGLFTAHHMLI